MAEYSFSTSLSLGEKESRLVKKSVSPDLDSRHEKRSRVEINTDKKNIVISIEAKDRAALRASVNSYLKSIVLSEKLRRLFE